MKKTLLALAAVLSIGMSYAQNPAKRYNATYSTGATYTPITGGTELAFDANWVDTVSDNITIPFLFNYQNVTVNSIAIESTGSLFLNDLTNNYVDIGHISGINMAYAGKGRGKISYATTGTTGDRIFKVEFRNVGRKSDGLGQDTLNFQVWLYESDNAIEYRAGYNNVPDTMFANTFTEMTTGGKEAVVCGMLNNPGDSIAVTATNSFVHTTKFTPIGFSDTAITLINLGVMGPLPNIAAIEALLYGAYPREGSVIRFAPRAPSSIGKIDFDMATVFPNPSKDGKYNLSLKEAPKAGALITIYDMTGKMVLQQALNTAKTTLDLGRFANGNYIGKINNGDRTGSFKLIKD